jgi:hypothetical protein
LRILLRSYDPKQAAAGSSYQHPKRLSETRTTVITAKNKWRDELDEVRILK